MAWRQREAVCCVCHVATYIGLSSHAARAGVQVRRYTLLCPGGEKAVYGASAANLYQVEMQGGQLA